MFGLCGPVVRITSIGRDVPNRHVVLMKSSELAMQVRARLRPLAIELSARVTCVLSLARVSGVVTRVWAGARAIRSARDHSAAMGGRYV